jgi:hypothetical protein
MSSEVSRAGSCGHRTADLAMRGAARGDRAKRREPKELLWLQMAAQERGEHKGGSGRTRLIGIRAEGRWRAMETRKVNQGNPLM